MHTQSGRTRPGPRADDSTWAPEWDGLCGRGSISHQHTTRSIVSFLLFFALFTPASHSSSSKPAGGKPNRGATRLFEGVRVLGKLAKLLGVKVRHSLLVHSIHGLDLVDRLAHLLGSLGRCLG